MSVRFNARNVCCSASEKLQHELGIPRFMANVLVGRGIDTPEKADVFFNPDLHLDWGNPYNIPGMYELVNALEDSIRADEHILIFGDFDLDGISATTVITRTLRKLGAKVKPYIPHRFEEGYSITQEAIDRIMAMPHVPDLILTVDCGISCKNEVDILLKKGIKVLITDHHEPGELVPVGIPVVDPKLSGPAEDAILAGVGVALKVCQAIGARFGYPYYWLELIDFATLGTVADLMPMIGENRALVKAGLEVINQKPRPCIAALLRVSNSSSEVSSTSLSYSIIPRLNAAGRMGDASVALNLMLCDDELKSTELALQLEEINTSRRQIEGELAVIAKEQAERIYDGQRVLVVAGENWHEGVKGIVASRLVNTYGVPSLLFSIENGEARGSGRSVGKINLFKAIESVSDLCLRFGGHEAAVGVSLEVDKLPEFTRRLNEYMSKMPDDAFHPPIEIDSMVSLLELSIENVRMLERLAPFGHENPVPIFLAQNVTLINKRAVGADKGHFSCSLSDGVASTQGIMFNCTDIDTLLGVESVVNAAFTLQIDEWRGKQSVKAMLKTIAPAHSCGALEACMSSKTHSFISGLYASSDEDALNNSEESMKEIDRFEEGFAENRKKWEKLAHTNPQLLQQYIVKAIIGDSLLHESQIQVLQALAAGKSVFSIMATGRGKSLTFQVQAALMALRDRKASVFIYPLRALITDQYYHLNTVMQQFGIRSVVLNGETPQSHRKQSFQDLRDGLVDIVLTTPEFFNYHSEEFSSCNRIGFVAIDEAHHLGMATGTKRPAYAHIGQNIMQLKTPAVLALTATANEKISHEIKRSLRIQEDVFDRSRRMNLHIDDYRFMKNRDDYLAHIVARGEKTLVYVNSRSESVVLARKLRLKVPQLASQIGFYNAGLSRYERGLTERLFRSGNFCTLIATSAFGEGVNIPDIRHVVLYNMPFNEIEFNQMCGRAGRDGKPAVIHLMYNKEDKLTNERILQRVTPSRDDLVVFYKSLRNCQKDLNGAPFIIDANNYKAVLDNEPISFDPVFVTCGLSVFSELGLVEAHPSSANTNDSWHVTVNPAAVKVDLRDSVRFQEGKSELADFEDFCKWALYGPVSKFVDHISQPILPDEAKK